MDIRKFPLAGQHLTQCDFCYRKSGNGRQVWWEILQEKQDIAGHMVHLNHQDATGNKTRYIVCNKCVVEMARELAPLKILINEGINVK